MATQRQHDMTGESARAKQSVGYAANDSAVSKDYEDDLPLADSIVQLPGAQLVYRALKSWQEEFAPKQYGEMPVPIDQPKPGQGRY